MFFRLPGARFSRRAAQYLKNSGHKHGGSRWTAGNVAVDWQHVIDSTHDGVTAGKNTSAAPAGPNRNHEFGSRGCLERLPYCLCHIAGDGAGYEQHVRMLGRGHEVDTEAFKVVIRIGKGGDLGFAAIARSGIQLSNIESPPDQ